MQSQGVAVTSWGIGRASADQGLQSWISRQLWWILINGGCSFVPEWWTDDIGRQGATIEGVSAEEVEGDEGVWLHIADTVSNHRRKPEPALV